MKKAFAFLAILTVLDFLFRKGILASLIPFKVPLSMIGLVLFLAFAIAAWWLTKRFCGKGEITFSSLGISFNTSNRRDFLYGFLVGVALWALVSVLQSILTGFSWQWASEINLTGMLYGLMFIFIADLGTELFTRGYPLTRFEKSSGPIVAIIIMVVFVGLKSYSPGVEGELLFYTMLIPALHTIFFSFIYFKTGRLGGALGVHTGANFVTISIFDLRPDQAGQLIPEGIFRPSIDLETVSIGMLQFPYVLMALLLSLATYYWWSKK